MSTAPDSSPTRPSAAIRCISLGCAKALNDSERLLGALRADGYSLTAEPAHADLTLINTCGFIEEAIAESEATIAEALQAGAPVVVTGCLGARRDAQGRAWLQEKFPALAAITGPSIEQALLAVRRVLPLASLASGAAESAFAPAQHPFTGVPARLALAPRHIASLKISEGCNRDCSFCIIPQLRGRLVSRPIAAILDEAEALLQSGVKEILLISQDSSDYGADRKHALAFWRGQPLREDLTSLVSALGPLVKAADAWLRLLYLYPHPHLDALPPLLDRGLALPYMDVPLQHAHAHVLRRMKRPGDYEGLLRRIQIWRDHCSPLTLRSTFIVGFPGETELEFAALLNFLEQAQLDRVGAFAYSPVAGAAANDLPDAVPAEVRQERLARFMERAEAISIAKLSKRIDAKERVLVDQSFSQGKQGGIARSAAEAPEIDGIIRIAPEHRPSRTYAAGEFVRVRITGVDGHDLLARCL